MKTWRLYAVVITIWLIHGNIHGQKNRVMRILFYNTQNFFDTEDDSLTEDNEFIPTGQMHWTPAKYNRKIQNIFKVIANTGWSPPEIIGLAEVENDKVLKDLLFRTPLAGMKYKPVHFDSPDSRGIDVALLFRSDRLTLLDTKPIPVRFTEAPNRKTRDILYCHFVFRELDTLYLFINHWPSRRGGELESETFRACAARVLRSQLDSILAKNARAKIMITGDFNDNPEDPAILQYLNAQKITEPVSINKLYNLFTNYSAGAKTGTLYFQGQWYVFDQIMVTGGLIETNKGLFTTPADAHIYAPDFLLQTDEKNLNVKPFPTYTGPRYAGGYSDHLPVYLDLFLRQ